MEKIASLFLPTQHNQTTLEINPQARWVMEGRGHATRMYDGLCYAVIEGLPYRHAVTRTPGAGFIHCCFYERQWWGWEPVPSDDLRFWKTWDEYDRTNFDWTYELIGPDIHDNPEESARCVMVPHGRWQVPELNTPSIETIQRVLITSQFEGIVWWEDLWDTSCRKVKVQQSDFHFIRGKKHDRSYAR